ncbi:hypothetical protein VW35_01995 [Devosia soli]|uniref:SMP-30/Gluconolactonase/LRE-like region domain-containing protein n=1 Tax=Devosia soli TaxID=361041 RepID=A0A0F5LF46_9HYPH|nr:SMP-30/gluconolactonase/LRE family protein [Devosia soli]KKB80973.1 hypothetical protein VW35_01995 [Devosia soli]
MPGFKAEPLVAAGNDVGESPVWDAASESLYWLDIPNGRIQRRTADGVVHRWTAPMMIGSIVLDRTGKLIAATERGFARLTLDGSQAQLDPIADILLKDSGKRFNGGACDRDGRFWAGTMRLQANPADPGGTLYCLSDDGQVSAHLDGFITQNGLAWSPDGRTMYVSDSHPTVRTIWALDFQDGSPSNRRVFSSDLPGRPDGASMDTDGCYWIAATDAGKILRLTPEGKIDAEVIVPVPNPTKLCFGGNDLRTGFITSLRSRNGAGGDVYVVELPFQGMPKTPACLP